MSLSKPARKRQTRLGFSPLPSSSPAAKTYSKQIRDRAAAVTIRDSPAKRRKTCEPDSDVDSNSINEDPKIPTPAATVDAISDDSDDLPIRPTQSRSVPSASKTMRPKQRRIDFSCTRESTSFDPPVTLSSSPRRRRSTQSGIFSSQAQGQVVDLSSDNDTDPDDVLSPQKLLLPSRSEIMGQEQNIPRRAIRGSQTLPPEEEEEEQSDNIIVGGGKERIEENIDTDDDEMPVVTQRRRRKPQMSPQVIESDDTYKDDMPTTAGTKRKRRKARTTRRGSMDCFISDSPPRAIESDDDLLILEQPMKKRRQQASESESEDEDEPRTPGRRGLKQARKLTQSEKDDLAEDLDFLNPGSDVEENAAVRSTQSARKLKQQQALEQLRRRRSSQKLQLDEEQQDGDADDNESGNNESDDDDDEEDDAPHFISSRQMFQENADDAAFVDEDDEDDRLGVPENMPLKFTRYASRKPKELFKHAVEWMVQKRINPAFQRDDDIYVLTFKKLNDEVKGLAGSKFTSSAWTPEFTLALNARPYIECNSIDRNSAEHFLRDKCDACNRSGHPATFEVRFRGKPYNQHTLEEVAGPDDDDEDSESSNDEEAGVDHKGREIAAAGTLWYVGKFCQANAETAHRLHHWRYHLNGEVESYLTLQGYDRPEKLAERNNWNTEKRRRYANKITDRMEQDGQVRALWRVFRDYIDNARNSKQGRFVADSP